MDRRRAWLLVCLCTIAPIPQVRAAIEVANGVATSEWPAVGSLITRIPNGPTFQCTATLISPTWVLTAAHCTEVSSDPQDYAFVMQPDEACCWASGGLPVVAVWANNFDALNPNLGHDEGLVQLAAPVTNVAPFIVNAGLTPPGPGSYLELLGYGLVLGSGNSLKRRGLLEVTEVDSALITFGYNQPYAQLCPGDSGGPAYAYAANGFPLIYGIASYREGDDPGCSMADLSRNSRTDSDIAWIVSHATDACTTSTPGNCDGIFRNGGESLVIAPAAPVVTQQPASAQVPAEWIATFHAAAAGDPLPTVQWQTSPDGNAFTDIDGETSPSLDVAADPAIDGAHFRAVFANALDTAQTGDAILTVLPREDYVPWHCTDVAGTLDIFWEEVDGAVPACIGIEHTDGSLIDAADGAFSMNGVSASNACLAPSKYEFTLSGDHKTLSGSDTVYNVPMTLTLSSDGACFVGHWTLGPNAFVATIWNFVGH